MESGSWMESEAKVGAGLSKAVAVVAGCAVALSLAPAIRAAVNSQSEAESGKVSLKMLGSIGSFTPVTRDEKLARAYAEAARESQTRGFRFTPASGALNGQRSLTVAVRAINDSEIEARRTVANLGVAPVSYSLGKAKGIERFAAGVGTAVVTSGSRELSPITETVQMPTASFALQPQRNRFSTNLQVEARDQTATAPTADAPQTLGQEKTYTVDLSSSYSVTKHLDVQAGLRYRGPDNRLVPALTDQAKDSQAVYVGTKFKF